jgi:hypothetical protein
MPAASDHPAPGGQVGPVEIPHTWRPLGVRVSGIVLFVGLAVVCALTWIGFDAETRARFTPFQRGTLAFFGLLTFTLFHSLTRSRVVAEPDQLVVVNGYRRRAFEWAQVIAVRLPPGAPWVTLDLADGTTVSAMGIQGSDGARAKRAARELRATVERQTHR